MCILLMYRPYAHSELASSLGVCQNMSMKIFTLTLLMCHLFIVSANAESLAEMRQRAKSKRASSTTTYSTSSNTSNQTNITYKEQSGYNTQVHILGSERKFERVRFVPNMFNAWVQLMADAQTLDLISQLKAGGYVYPDGTLKGTVSELSVPLQPYQVIQRKPISEYYKQKYSTAWIFKTLQEVDVLDSDGFLTQTEDFSDSYNSDAFQQYLPLLRTINFNFSSAIIGEELRRELLRFLQESSLSIHVTQEETTRYQSRKEGFLDGFLDQLGGSFLGSLFYKDKIQTVKRKITYSPNINVYSMFTNIYFGFVPGPYYKGASSELAYYGVPQQKTIEFQYGKESNERQRFGAAFHLHQLRGANVWDEVAFSHGLMVSHNDVRDNTAHYTWQNIRYVGSMWRLQGLTGSFSGGLSGFGSDQTSGTKIGLGFGTDGTYHITSGFGAYYNFDLSFGLDWTDSSQKFPWLMTMYGVGIQTAIAPIRLRVGYEWIVEENELVIYDAFTASLSCYF
jgi:hypothetical protein